MSHRNRPANIVLNERRRFVPALQGWKKAVAWPLAYIVAGGLVCGGAIWLNRPPPAERPFTSPPDGGPSSSAVSAGDIPPTIPLTDDLPRADDIFRSGDILGASQAYGRLLVKAPQPGEPLRYRNAICLELLQDAEHALSAYQALAGSSSHLGFVNAALLGQVRVHSQSNRWDAARKLLLTMILTSGGRGNSARSAFHHLAQLATRETFAADIPLYDDAGIVISEWNHDVERLLDLPAELGGTDATTHPAALSILDRLGDDPSTIHVAIDQRDVPLATLLDQLLGQAKLNIHWSPAAAKIGESRLVNVTVVDLDLAMLLDGLLEPIDLVWVAKPPDVHIATRLEVPPDYAQRLRQLQAERICHTALSVFPDYAGASRTYMSLGDIAFHQGHYQDANSYYREIIRRDRDVQITRDTWFNLAKSLRQLDLLDEARAALFKVVDHARGHAIEPLAYLYLGQSFLEASEADAAIRHLVRAVSLAQDGAVRQLSVLTLASAYLLAGNPQAANMTLMDHRDILQGEPHRRNALFLSSLARFRAAAIPTERLRRGRTLTASLAEAEPHRFFTFAGTVLLGQAYMEIGMSNQMQEVYASAVDAAKPHALRDETILVLANHYLENNQPAQGKELYEKLIDHGRPPWSRQARIRAAELAHVQGDDDQCLDQCYHLIKTSISVKEKTEVLRLMGRVYERQADHYKAALCFAGLIPRVAGPTKGQQDEL